MADISPDDNLAPASRDADFSSQQIVEVECAPDDNNLLAYAATFGLKLEDLNPQQILVLLAARGAEKHVRDLKIPMSERSVDSGRRILVEREVERVIEKTAYRESEKPSAVPADRMDLTNLEAPEQLPQVLPGEWLIEDVAPETFLRKLRERTLLRREWREPTRTPITSHETIKEKVLVEEPAPPEIHKQHACVLLDISGSMIESEDGRNVVAAGLALAFLRNGFKQRAHLSLRMFNGYVFDRLQGSSAEDLKRIAWRILNIEWGGGTDIQDALKTAVADIHEGGAFTRADILLISDGLSWLGSNPLEQIKLHTFLLGLSAQQLKDANCRNAVNTLSSWSTTLKIFGSSRFAGIVLPSRQDLDDIEKSIRSIPDGFKNMTSEDEKALMRERISDFRKLVHILTRAVAEVEERLSPLEKLRADLAQRRLRSMTAQLEEMYKELALLSPEVLNQNKARREREAKILDEQRLAEEELRRQRHAEKEAEAARALEAMLSQLRGSDIPGLEPRPGSSGSQNSPQGSFAGPQSTETPEERNRRISLWQRLRRWLEELRSSDQQAPDKLPPKTARPSRFRNYRGID